VIFIPIVEDRDDSARQRAAGVRQEAGTYTLPGLPAGKYRISVRAANRQTDKDLLGERFSEGTSAIIRDITGDQTIDLNLDRPTG
jgi:hypothetical protein